MTDALWKAAERRIARALGGRRVPVSGRCRGDSPDIAHDWLSIEVKTRKQLPVWLLDAMDQARCSARGQRLPIVVLHQTGHDYRRALVITTLDEFVEHFGRGGDAA